MARNIPINYKEEDRTEYECYGNSEYLDFWYISRLYHIGRFGLDFDDSYDNEEDEVVYNDLSEYIDEKDFINMLHMMTSFELENPVTWNN